jgi:broad specificity phosphatase PhoE
MSTRFMLVRHALCAHSEQLLFGHAIDPPLDQRGESQAHALAQRLTREAPALVMTSPRLRARQTAAAIALAARCALHTTSALDEVDFGCWGGHAFAELEHDPRWRHWNAARGSAATPGGETYAAIQARVLAYLDELSFRFAGTLVLVTHAEIIRAALLKLLGVSADEFMRIEIAPASLTILHATPSGPCIDTINDCNAHTDCVSA